MYVGLYWKFKTFLVISTNYIKVIVVTELQHTVSIIRYITNIIFTKRWNTIFIINYMSKHPYFTF